MGPVPAQAAVKGRGRGSGLQRAEEVGITGKRLSIRDWGLLDYGLSLERQLALVSERVAGGVPDSLVFVEHPPAVTLGRSADDSDLLLGSDMLGRKGVGLYRVDRGGRATYHGPGQLVVYPVLGLRSGDLPGLVKNLLQTAADVLTSFGLAPRLQPERPGLWVGGAKIASVGLAVKRWVTYHGLALNVSVDTAGFRHIVCCGNPEETVTSMEEALGRRPEMDAVKEEFATAFCERFGYERQAIGRAGGRRHPSWLCRAAPDPGVVRAMEASLQRQRLNTVCQSSRCPNLGECFGRQTATFMILGSRCTRDCRFCAVTGGPPEPVDPEEPCRVALAARDMGLCHVVITSVTRDDLSDGGAGQFAETVRQVRRVSPGATVEVLVPDFNGSVAALDRVLGERPDVFNHNLETVAGLYRHIRPGARYARSLGILRYAAREGLTVKSGLMLGLGERRCEIRQALLDLKRAGCRWLTLGQYLSPSEGHAPVARYASPQEFDRWAALARDMGFDRVRSGPLVRSSYRADAPVSPARRRAREERHLG